jgi:hypothetical protein
VKRRRLRTTIFLPLRGFGRRVREAFGRDSPGLGLPTRTRARDAVTRCGALRRLMRILRFDFFFIRILRTLTGLAPFGVGMIGAPKLVRFKLRYFDSKNNLADSNLGKVVCQ